MYRTLALPVVNMRKYAINTKAEKISQSSWCVCSWIKVKNMQLQREVQAVLPWENFKKMI